MGVIVENRGMIDQFLSVLRTLVETENPVLVLLGVVITVFVVVWVLLMLINAAIIGMRRLRAEADGGVRIPMGFRVKPAKINRETGAFILVYPRWQKANKDGTRNYRYRDNAVVKGFSVLELGRWRFASRSVLQFYEFVVRLRSMGHVIAPSREEMEKLNQVSARARLRWTGNTSGGLYHRFAEAPSQFETFCAELYRELGYQVEVTPPVADGGFDLDMFRSGERTLVECKCFKPDNPVGRPVLQKLFGANATENANRLIAVTTSTFSRGAIAYAKEVGIELVEGRDLVAMCSRVWGAHSPTQEPMMEDAQLSLEDHLLNMPIDIRDRYASVG